MALLLTSKDKSTFIQNLLRQINSSTKTINPDSNIEVIFENNPKYTQFKLVDHTLHFKNILPSLIDLLGVEDGVWTFIDRFNNAFYEILSTYDQVIELDEQFIGYKKALFNYVFASKDSLHSHILLSLHNDNLIQLDERNYKIVSYQTAIGYFVPPKFKFHTEENKDILSLEDMLNTAIKIKNGLKRKEESDLIPYKRSIKNKNLDNLKIMDNISTIFNNSNIQNESKYSKKYFNNKQIINSVYKTLKNKCNYLSEKNIETIEVNLASFIEKLSKDKNKGKYSLEDLLTILSIFYFRYLYIDSNEDNHKNSPGDNLYFAILFNNLSLNRINSTKIMYKQLHNKSNNKTQLHKDIQKLHKDINKLTDKHLYIQFEEGKENEYLNINLSNEVRMFSNILIHKLFYIEQFYQFELLLTMLSDIDSFVLQNLNYIQNNPSTFITLMNSLNDAMKNFEKDIVNIEKKATNITLENLFYDDLKFLDFSDLPNSHLSLIHSNAIFEKVHLRENYFKSKPSKK
ncbi:hypothetical protein [Staphylococcus delphini]|uniref:hypothetical protein n=1 Tax=Staphylococcus delphini TaxID=53344 RepID=UPI000BBC6FE1|nr:hypothetical protein [Staphylococcus delphini]PCF76590.1 hypothetical protein B4W71_01320 [Staphylococcus delphini]